MKTIYTHILLVAGSLCYSQVGIKTLTPEKTLDVNGGLNIRKELRLSGNDVTKGSAGTEGQIFSVTGTTALSDEYKTVKVADGAGSLTYTYLNTTTDRSGVKFSVTGSTNPYSLNSGFTTSTDTTTPNWAKLAGNTDTFSITDTTQKSKAILSFQTNAQIAKSSPTGNYSASFACGIFVKKGTGPEQLKAVRSDVVRGVSGSYKIFNLNVTLDKLDPGVYTVSAACSNRNLGSGTNVVNLGVGTPVDATFMNQDMSQSTMTVTVLQPF